MQDVISVAKTCPTYVCSAWQLYPSTAVILFAFCFNHYWHLRIFAEPECSVVIRCPRTRAETTSSELCSAFLYQSSATIIGYVHLVWVSDLCVSLYVTDNEFLVPWMSQDTNWRSMSVYESMVFLLTLLQGKCLQKRKARSRMNSVGFDVFWDCVEGASKTWSGVCALRER